MFLLISYAENGFALISLNDKINQIAIQAIIKWITEWKIGIFVKGSWIGSVEQKRLIFTVVCMCVCVCGMTEWLMCLFLIAREVNKLLTVQWDTFTMSINGGLCSSHQLKGENDFYCQIVYCYDLNIIVSFFFVIDTVTAAVKSQCRPNIIQEMTYSPIQFISDDDEFRLFCFLFPQKVKL